jgi:hypothetical protein
VNATDPTAEVSLAGELGTAEVGLAGELGGAECRGIELTLIQREVNEKRAGEIQADPGPRRHRWWCGLPPAPGVLVVDNA